MEVAPDMLWTGCNRFGKEAHPLAGVVVAHHKQGTTLLWRLLFFRSVALEADAGRDVRDRYLGKHLAAAFGRRLRDTNEQIRPLEASAKASKVKPAYQSTSAAPLLHRAVSERDDAWSENEEVVHHDGFGHVPWNTSWNEMRLLLIGHQQHVTTAFLGALLEAMTYATRMEPPASEQTPRC